MTSRIRQPENNLSHDSVFFTKYSILCAGNYSLVARRVSHKYYNTQNSVNDKQRAVQCHILIINCIHAHNPRQHVKENLEHCHFLTHTKNVTREKLIQ